MCCCAQCTGHGRRTMATTTLLVGLPNYDWETLLSTILKVGTLNVVNANTATLTIPNYALGGTTVVGSDLVLTLSGSNMSADVDGIHFDSATVTSAQLNLDQTIFTWNFGG